MEKKFNLRELKFGNSNITSTNSIKFLGIIMDEHLNFKSHVDSICTKISKIVGLLFRLNNIVPREALCQLYTSLITPHILYGIEIWHGILKINDDRIFKLQKKAIRACNRLDYNAHTNDHFKTMDVLKVQDIYKLRVLLFTYDRNNLSHSDTHLHNTRFSNNLVLPALKRSRTQAAVFYQGIKLWNDLPIDIRNLEKRNNFRNTITKRLLDEY